MPGRLDGTRGRAFDMRDSPSADISDRQPALVVFDLGRVLVRICDGWQHAFERAGVTLPHDVLDAPTRERLLDGVKRIEVGETPVESFCEEIAGHLRLSCDVVTRMWEGYCLGPFPGADELLADLAAAGATTACLSNTNAEHWRTLTDPDDPHGRVINRLDHRFASHLLRARKPDAEIYAHVERATGFAPGQIIFFDDLAENVAAARERGWRAHLIERCENPIPAIWKYLRDASVL
jgi:putative hydrolase of the HAD superfamily